MTRFLDAGSVGTGGVTLIVDGLEGTRAGVSASAIQEVKINQNPYSAEFSRPGRGRIEILTKPGSFSLRGLYTDRTFNNQGALALDGFNVLNQVNYVSFVGNLSSPFFGKAVAARPPRRLQLSTRFKF